KIFGRVYTTEQIIDEKLKTCTQGMLPNAVILRQSIIDGIDQRSDEQIFIQHPLANWLELTIALNENQGKLERGKPLSIRDISVQLKKATEIDIKLAENAVTAMLQWAEILNERNRSKRK